jgi:hypothetical protein
MSKELEDEGHVSEMHRVLDELCIPAGPLGWRAVALRRRLETLKRVAGEVAAEKPTPKSEGLVDRFGLMS